MKITSAKNHELVAGHMLEQIQSGAWQPGQRLPSVVELAEQYGVGRSTIREATSALKATGWLDVRHGGGTFVKAVLPSDPRHGADMLFESAGSLAELLEVRRALEAGAVRLAALRRGEPELARLREAFAQMRQALELGDTAAGERADTAFHMAIAGAAGNPLLAGMMESLADRFEATIRQTRELRFYREPGTAERLLEEHAGILDAIERGDASLAERRLTAHLDGVLAALQEAIAGGKSNLETMNKNNKIN
ncbi:Transcriptional regulator, GntR family [Paenibacillus pasadenensis]|uniref:Transcriptional regulator, GntR family n=1 Tax=Paenibacillus pasadenensis TaxID=217090 RepID=A0A2N5N1U2_9BACL|nr:FadR/GntR family transcriptional regulator [Paenibacillus pasadenensis]PLT44302.1 Transcriptional regulator, GntR family [Paenibacillus pasadenensis]